MCGQIIKIFASAVSFRNKMIAEEGGIRQSSCLFFFFCIHLLRTLKGLELKRNDWPNIKYVSFIYSLISFKCFHIGIHVTLTFIFDVA